MLKKIIIPLLVLTLLCGCTKEENNTNTIDNKDSLSLKNELSITESNLIYKKLNIDCEEIKNIIDFNFYTPSFITTDGSLYLFSFDKLFKSSNKNCVKLETNTKFIKFIKNGIIDTDNNIYYIDNDTIKLYQSNIGMINMPYNISKDDYKNTFNNTNNTTEINIYYNNNKIYNYEDKTTIIFTPQKDEEISYVLDGTIKTNKAFYIYDIRVTNKEECTKYEDISCNYEKKYYLAKELSNYYDEILFYKNSNNLGILIDNNLNIFSNYLGG